MTAAIPTSEPSRFAAGDTVKWTKSLADYPPSTWTLTYYLVPRNGDADQKVTVAATASGSDHAVELDPATTAAMNAEEYDLAGFVDDGSDRFRVFEGTVYVEEDITQAAGTRDARSHAEKVLDAINALLEGKATRDQKSYTIGNRALERYTPDELLAWQKHYTGLVNKQRAAERGRRTGASGRTIHAVLP